MKQYLLSVYQPDGAAARRPRSSTRSCADLARPQRGDEGRRRVGLLRRPARRRAPPPSLRAAATARC